MNQEHIDNVATSCWLLSESFASQVPAWMHGAYLVAIAQGDKEAEEQFKLLRDIAWEKASNA